MPNIPELLKELSETRAFNRIRRISFLGIVDQINQQLKGVRPAFSRAEHSFGVLDLGLAAAKHINMDEVESAYLLAACMVHDLGHPPFSHSLEYAFKKGQRTINHHEVLREILLQPRGAERQVARILLDHGISPERVFRIVDGEDDLSFFFLSPINIDTLDGISRSMRSFGFFSTYDVHSLTQAVADLYDGQKVEDHKSLADMDKFWDQKNLFYKVLSSENPLSLAERRFQRIVRNHLPRLERTHFRMTDQEFVHRYPQIMYEFGAETGPEAIAGAQEFRINPRVGSVDRETVYKRYIRIRHEIRAAKVYAS
ncbi:HD domain-containing protein [Devosia sp. 1566]|uniref:HD domain-containing protein n=1 Tax=Devosia sp. 1566 TaxID=2499144 RepID=UPI000FDBCB2C|nr:HD domain-containing protein [Devosia sp. 1566]